MRNNEQNISLLRKLLKKKAALVALVIIGLTSLVATFAYQLAPDNTPYANNMIVELGAKDPGFTQEILLIPRTFKQPEISLLNRIFNGTPHTYNTVPINGYYFKDTLLMARHYIDNGIEDTIAYSLTTITGHHADVATMQKEVVKDHIRTITFYLGTDRFGRDILSRLLVGARVSLSVGFIAVLLSISLGILLGAISGYYGGIIDNMVMWVINILWAIPTLLLVFAITLTIGKGFWQIFIAIGLTMWVSAARLIRGQVMAVKEMEYITAARALGLKDSRIIFRHILPNIAGPVMVIAAGNFATAILIESGLSFLGIGVQPPTPSWGLMIKEHYNFLLTNKPFLAIIPGVATMLLVYAFNILGNALRDVLDVKQQ